jgi:predicted RNA-binding Zn-ribbon protein involved in translation (DUF1610 family)
MGKCPKCGSLDILFYDTLDMEYDESTLRTKELCECGECGATFIMRMSAQVTNAEFEYDDVKDGD